MQADFIIECLVSCIDQKEEAHLQKNLLRLCIHHGKKMPKAPDTKRCAWCGWAGPLHFGLAGNAFRRSFATWNRC